MKVIKFKKIKNKYKVYFDNDTNIDLYEDTILKYDLLLKKDIDNKKLDEIVEYNNMEEIYFISIKYISLKIRSKEEIYNYLRKKQFNEKDIKVVIARLEKEKIIDDEIYVKSYVHDRFLLSSEGPYKIKNSLLNLKIDESIIDRYINEISEEDINDKLNRLIDKKIKTIKNYSGNVLKIKIINYFNNLGYSKKEIEKVLDTKNISNNENGKKEYLKLYNKYSKKFEGYELENIIRNKLYSKGYDYNEIKKDID